MIVVLVPELDALLAEASAVPRLLGKLLARSDTHALEAEAAESVLVTGRPMGAAALSRLADCPNDASGIWLRADPVRLQPDINAVWLQGDASLSDEARCELIEGFGDDGMQLDFPAPDRGYLRLPALPDCRFQPPWRLAGLSLDHVLPQGPDAKRWQRLLNESQVILHQHIQAANGNTAGSLWFWGAGALPSDRPGSARVSHLVGTSPVLAGLARLLALSHEPVVHRRPPADGSLVLWSARSDRSAADNLAALSDWLAPVWQRLGRFRLDRLELASRDRCHVLKPGNRWQFWRRPVDLAT